jgi:predicted nucleic acid-binding protein
MFYTTDLVLEELYDHQKESLTPFIEEGQLQIQSIDEDDFLSIYQIQVQRPQLSEQDCSAFYQAQKLDAILLTSDKVLRRLAQQKALEVHGHLWVFDEMVAAGTLSPKAAIQKLDELCEEVNPRLGLPKGECERRREECGFSLKS